MNRIRTVAVFPTVFTLGNLICGFFAIVVAARVERPTSINIPPAADIIFRHPTRGHARSSTRPTTRTTSCSADG